MGEKQTFAKSSDSEILKLVAKAVLEITKSQQNMLSTSLMVKKVKSTLTGQVLRKLKLSHFIK